MPAKNKFTCFKSVARKEAPMESEVDGRMI
jgi:hypothetical protein